MTSSFPSNVIITPHIASVLRRDPVQDGEARRRKLDRAAGKVPEHAVNPQIADSWRNRCVQALSGDFRPRTPMLFSARTNHRPGTVRYFLVLFMVSDEDVGNLCRPSALGRWRRSVRRLHLGRTTQHSTIYVNLRLLVSNPVALSRAAVMLEEIQTLQDDALPAGRGATSASAFRSAASTLPRPTPSRSRVPMIYVHPAKSGTAAASSPKDYNPEETVLLIDDLTTSGGGIIETHESSAPRHLDVKDARGCSTATRRPRAPQEGYNLISILGLETMLNYLMHKVTDEEQYRASVDRASPRAPSHHRTSTASRHRGDEKGHRPSLQMPFVPTLCLVMRPGFRD